jgi:carbon-monoxide dehydrogenase large subunit
LIVAKPSGEAALTQWGEFQGRVEDNRLVTGQGLYIADIAYARTAHAVVVRAQVASARVKSIDTDAALASPGVLAVYTGRDLAEVRHSCLPEQSLCRIGEP